MTPIPAPDRIQSGQATSQGRNEHANNFAPLLTSAREHQEFEDLLADLSTAFVRARAEEVDAQIDESLRRIVEFLDVDRCSLGECLEDGPQLLVTHSYEKPGIPALPRAILNEMLPWYVGRIFLGEVLRFDRLPEDLPPEAVREREYVVRIGMKSHVVIPFKVCGTVLGAVGVASFRRYRAWPDELVQRFRIVGELFTHALARKRADLALHEEEGRFRLMADTAPVMVWVSGPDKRCTYFNKPWLDFTGRALEREVGDGWSEGVHPDDVRRCLDTYVQAFDARQAFRMEYRLRRFDGEYRWVIDAGVPRFESDGTFDGYIGSCIDITEQKQGEEALRESEARLRLLLESTKAVPWVADARSGRFTYVGPQVGKLLGYPADDWYAEGFWADHMHPDDREWVPAFCREHALRDTDYEFDYRMVAADGKTVWLHDVVHVIREGGEPALLRGFLIDVTSRRAAEEEALRLRDQLARAARVTMMGELAAAIAHEIYQPLCAIVSNAQAAQRFLAGDVPDAAEARAALLDIVTDGQRAGEVIGRIKTLLQKGQPTRVRFDLNGALREVVALVRHQLGRKGITFSADLAEDLPPVYGDRVQVQQVVLNLLVNAMDALGHAAAGARRLSLRSARDGRGTTVVSVRDSGPGVPAEHLDQIFDALFTTKPDGMGIGLAISRSIVEAHGGRIWADTGTDGAAFHFTLPPAEEPTP